MDDENALVRIDLWPHPLTSEGRQTIVTTAGARLSEIFHGSVPPGMPAVAVVNGKQYPLSEWDQIIVGTTDLIQIRALVHGAQDGGDSNPVATILTIALLAAAPLAAPALGITSGTFAAGLVTAGVSIAGILVINSLFPPRLPREADPENQLEDQYAIGQASNAVRQHRPLLMLLGRHQIFPDIAALPYTEFDSASDQYLNQIFDFGIGDLNIGTVKIGDTPLSNYNDFDTEPSLSAYSPPAAIYSVKGNVNTLEEEDFDPFTSVWVVRTAPEGTVRISIDLAVQHFRTAEDGALTGILTNFSVAYRKGTKQADESYTYPATWTEPENGTFDVLTASGARARHMTRVTKNFDVEAGNYEVRIIKNTSYEGEDDEDYGRVSLRAQLVGIKAFQPENADFTGRNALAIRIKATGQLYGSLDQVNAICEAKVNDWSGGDWSTVRYTSNPASILLWFLRGYWVGTGADRRLRAGYGLDDDQIDFESLQLWHAFCDDNNLECNMVVKDERAEDDIARVICQCGWARMDRSSGKLGVIFESSERPVTAVVNPANVVAGSVNITYDNENLADEFVGTFIDKDSEWQTNTIRRPVTHFDTSGEFPVDIRLEGITNRLQAAKMLNQAAAAQYYHQRTITWEMDAEGIAIGIGDVVGMVNGLMGGTKGGRLSSISSDRLTLGVRFDPGTAAGNCWVWLLDGDIHLTTYTVSGGDVVLAEAMPEQDEYEDEPASYRIMLFANTDAYRKVRVTGIEPTGPQRLRFTARDELPEYYTERVDTDDYDLVEVRGRDSRKVEGLSVSQTENGILVISWAPYHRPVQGYLLRYSSPSQTQTWNNMLELSSGIHVASPYLIPDVPATGTGRVGIRAVLEEGIMSIPAYVSVDLEALNLRGERGPPGAPGTPGVAGSPGIDGESAQWRYRATSSSTAPDIPTDQTISAWQTNPPTYSASNPYIWVTARTRAPTSQAPNPPWSAWSAPLLWRGPDGEDGQGREWIFRRYNSGLMPLGEYPRNPTDRQVDDYYDSGRGWYDNARGVDEDNPYEWAADRRWDRTASPPQWGDFSTPYIWTHYGRDGEDGTAGISIGDFGFGQGWASGNTYRIGDLVTWAGALFECIRAHNSSSSNRPPSEAGQTSEFWRQVAGLLPDEIVIPVSGG